MLELPSRSQAPRTRDRIAGFLEETRVPNRLACNAAAGRPVHASRWFAPPNGRLWCVLLVGLLAGIAACRTVSPPLRVVDDVDLDRYLGRWHEIASLPQRFQRGCVATTATYTRREDGRIRVENECRDGSFDGDVRRAEGVAWLADPDGSRAKLQVQFFWPFRGDYWIIELDPDYRHAVVGHPSREYLWILSRTPTLDPAVYASLLSRIAAQGYDLERLKLTPQPNAASPRGSPSREDRR